MLHILWLILKFILITLGVLLGILVALLLAILFCPVCYGAEGKKEKEGFSEAVLKARVSWLFHLISFQISYQNKKMQYSLRLFGIPVQKVLDRMKKRKETSQKETEVKKAETNPSADADKQKEIQKEIAEKTEITEETEQTEQTEETEASEVTNATEATDNTEVTKEAETTEKTEITEETDDTEATKETEDIKTTEKTEITEEKEETEATGDTEAAKETEKTEVTQQRQETGETQQTEETQMDQTETENRDEAEIPAPQGEDAEQKTGNSRQFMHKLHQILDKIKSIPGKIADAYHNAEKTKAKISSQIAWWRKFTNHPRFQKACALIKKELSRVLHHVIPRKLSGHITFGSEDPALTGKVLAVLGITTPIHKNRVEITPLFDGTTTFVGNVSMKGRIYGIVLLIAFVRLYFSKDIKFVMHYWKKKKED